MGQQQLLLFVFGSIIVGLATVAGMNAYEESRKQAAIDQITQKALEIATDVQAYVARPPHMRVDNARPNADEGKLIIGFSELPKYETVDDGYTDGDYFTELAHYSLNGYDSLPEEYNENACPGSDPANTVNAYSEEFGVSVCVSITGSSEDDLEAGVAE